ncbi:MAG: DUF1456 family protein [Flavobacterium sp.]|nr:DUF1456 family protein [Flavobacterium sp.]
MNNNDIFKKLRVALQLRDDQIIEIMELVDFRISKGEIGNIFRAEDHSDFMLCGDQILRNFLNGLIIHLRGTKENPKNAQDVLKQNKLALQPKKDFVKKEYSKEYNENRANQSPKEIANKKPNSNFKSKGKRPEKKIEVVEKVKYNNGKQKKS